MSTLNILRNQLNEKSSWFAMTNRYNDGHGCAGSSCNEIHLGRGFHAVRGTATAKYSPALENIGNKQIANCQWLVICSWAGSVFGITYGSKIDSALTAFAEQAEDEDSNWVEELDD